MDNFSKWQPTKINQSKVMARCNFTTNWIEERPAKWWEKIRYFKFFLLTRQIQPTAKAAPDSQRWTNDDYIIRNYIKQS